MPQITLKKDQIDLLRSLVNIMIPHVSKSSIFQPTVISEINKRFTGTKTDHVSEEYLLHLIKRPGSTQVAFNGITLEGSPSIVVVHWNDPEVKETQHLGIDPFGIQCEPEDISFTWKQEEDSKIAPWCTRKNSEGSAKIRRISIDNATELLKILRLDLKERQEKCSEDITDIKDLICSLSAMCSIGIPDTSEACAIRQTKKETFGIWNISDGLARMGWGYIRDARPLGNERDLIVTRGLLKSFRVLNALMETFKIPIKEIKLSSNSKGLSVSFVGKGIAVKVVYLRENVVNSSNIEALLSSAEPFIKSINNKDIGKPQNLELLSTGLGMIHSWNGSSTHNNKGVCVELDPNLSESLQNFYTQQEDRTLFFFLGDSKSLSDKKDFDKLILQPNMVPYIHHQVRSWMSSQDITLDNIRLLTNNSVSVIKIGDEFQTGCISFVEQGIEETASTIQMIGDSSGPIIELDAKELDSSGILVSELSSIKNLVPPNAKTFGQSVEDKGIITIKEGKVLLQLGSDSSYLGSKITIPVLKFENMPSETTLRAEGEFVNLALLSKQMISLLKVFSKRTKDLKEQDLKVRLYLKTIFTKDNKPRIVPTIELRKEDEVLISSSFVSVMSSSHKKSVELGNWLPERPKDSGIEISNSFIPSLAKIAESFCMTKEKACLQVQQALVSLQCLYYNPEIPEAYCSNTFMAAWCKLPGKIFGDEIKCLTPGLIQASSILTKAKGSAHLTSSGKRACLVHPGDDDTQVHWLEPIVDHKIFPVESLKRILSKEVDWRDGDTESLVGCANGSIVPSNIVGKIEAGIKRAIPVGLNNERTFLVCKKDKLYLVPWPVLRGSTNMEEVLQFIDNNLDCGALINSFSMHPSSNQEAFTLAFNSQYLIKTLESSLLLCNDNKNLVAEIEIIPNMIKISQKDSWKLILCPMTIEDEQDKLLREFIKII